LTITQRRVELDLFQFGFGGTTEIQKEIIGRSLGLQA